MKNKLSSHGLQIFVCFIRLENLVCQNNPFVRIDLKIDCLPSHKPGFASSVGRSGFFCFGEGQSSSQGLTAF